MWRIFQWRELLGKLSVSGKWGCWVTDRMSSLVTYASSDSPQCHSVLLWIAGSDHYWHCYQNKYQILIAKTSAYLITSFQMEKIRILVYFVLACTPTCWNSVINNCYTCWLPVPCQSFVPKISCNFHNSDDKWDDKENWERKWFSHIHTQAEIISPSLPNSKACTQTLLPYTGSKMRNNLNNEIFKYTCFSLCVQDCAVRPLWVSQPC